MGWLVMSLRRLREGLAATLGLVILVLVTAFVFAAAPRVLDRVATDLFRADVSSVRADARNIALLQERRIPSGGDADPLGEVDATGADLETQVPEGLRSLFTDRVYIADTPHWSVVASPPSDATVRMRVQQGVDGHLAIVEGRLPTAVTGTTEPGDLAPVGTGPLQTFEVAISGMTAEVLGVGVGDRLELTPEPTDVRAVRRRLRIAAEVVGVFDIADLDAPYWSNDTTVDRPSVRTLSPEVVIQDATALLAPGAYPALLAATDDPSTTGLTLRYTWRFPLDPQRLQASAIDALTADLRRLESVFPATPEAAAGGGTISRSALLLVVEAFDLRWRAATAVLSVVAIGTATIAVLALGLVTLLTARRRRGALALGSERGASTAQIVGSVAAEGLVLSVPAAVIGLALAVALVPAGQQPVSIALAGGVAALTTLLLVAAGLPRSSAALRDPTRGSGIVRRAGARRLVLEATIVVVAIAGAVLLRDRGVQGASATGALAAPDPFIAAVPALVGVAVGIVVVRLFPIPMRLAAAVAARRRGLVAVLAMRRVTRGGSSGLLLVVLIATTTIGVFASAALLQLDRAAEAAAWRDVGAAFRLTTTASSATGTKAGVPIPLPADLDPAALPGVEAVALAHRSSVPSFPRGSQLEMLAIDAAAYTDVVRGTPVETAFPSDLLAAARGPASGAGASESSMAAIPAIVSSALADGVTGLAIGDEFRLIVADAPWTFRVVEVRDEFPSLAGVDRFAIVALDQLRAEIPGGSFDPNIAYVRAPASAAAALRDALAAPVPHVAVESRAEETARLRSAPTVGAVFLGIGLAALAAALYAALAVSAVLALSGAARATEVAQLRTLGLSGRQSVWLIVAEHGPIVAVAFVVGVVLGVALFAFLRPGLGLGSIIGSDVAVPLQVDPAYLVVVFATVVGIVAIGIGIAAAIQRRAVPALAVRRRME